MQYLSQSFDRWNSIDFLLYNFCHIGVAIVEKYFLSPLDKKEYLKDIYKIINSQKVSKNLIKIFFHKYTPIICN